MPLARSTSSDGVWRRPSSTGLLFDEFWVDSAWIRETAVLQLPSCEGVSRLLLRGEFRPHPDVRGIEEGAPSLTCRVDGRHVVRIAPTTPGVFEIAIDVTPKSAREGPRITLSLGGTGWTNFLAWLGRITGAGALQRFRAQNKNRQLRIAALVTAEGETVFDFATRLAPFSLAFARRHIRYEMNVVGFLTAELGVGESARCMARATDAAGIAAALVPLKLPCKNRRGDLTYASRLTEANPHRVNVIHIDAPASPDIDHHHGPAFRVNRYNVAYWAWELTEFPDSWVPNFAYFDEVWCPSEFTRAAIAMKSPLPVLTMPHAIEFARPTGDGRAHFGLPTEKFLFLFLYDLNSYSARKNPQAVIEAFRRAGLAERGAALVIKVQNEEENREDFAALQAAVRDLPGTVMITGTLPRSEIYLLQAACDCFVSLHRSEGFGLAVAESMYLGKPVISTDWSATAEFVSAENGCPVRYALRTIEKSRGPYTRGQTWAEPDVDHAAEWMQRVMSDRRLAAQLGQAARATIESRFSPKVIGERYRRRLEAIGTF